MVQRFVLAVLVIACLWVAYEIQQTGKEVSLRVDHQPTATISTATEKDEDASSADLAEQSAQQDEVVQIAVEDLEKPSANVSPVAASYQEIKIVPIDEEKRSYQITFKEPLKEYISILFIGEAGEVSLDDTYVHYEDGEIVAAQSLNESYFEKDWYRFESSGKAIQAISFKGKSVSSSGNIALYAQKKMARR